MNSLKTGSSLDNEQEFQDTEGNPNNISSSEDNGLKDTNIRGVERSSIGTTINQAIRDRRGKGSIMDTECNLGGVGTTIDSAIDGDCVTIRVRGPPSRSPREEALDIIWRGTVPGTGTESTIAEATDREPAGAATTEGTGVGLGAEAVLVTWA